MSDTKIIFLIATCLSAWLYREPIALYLETDHDTTVPHEALQVSVDEILEKERQYWENATNALDVYDYESALVHLKRMTPNKEVKDLKSRCYFLLGLKHQALGEMAQSRGSFAQSKAQSGAVHVNLSRLVTGE